MNRQGEFAKKLSCVLIQSASFQAFGRMPESHAEWPVFIGVTQFAQQAPNLVSLATGLANYPQGIGLAGVSQPDTSQYRQCFGRSG